MNESLFIVIAGYLYLLSMVLHISGITFRTKKVLTIAVLVSVVGLCFHLFAFCYRWFSLYKINQNFFFKSMPIVSMNESLLFFCLALMIIYIFGSIKYSWKIGGIFVTGFAGSLIFFTDFVSADTSMKPLLPVLQSNWLIAHVLLSFIAYVFFTLSAIAALIYLILESKSKREYTYIVWTTMAGIGMSIIVALIFDYWIAYMDDDIKGFQAFSATLRNNLLRAKIMYLALSLLMILFFWFKGLRIRHWFLSYNISSDNISVVLYKFVILGFVIFTLGGLIFGAIWAENAWGRYWSWDPKETWALITWFIYGLFLHTKSMKYFNDKACNTIALLGFLVTMFTYIGVNIFLSGLHSYS